MKPQLGSGETTMGERLDAAIHDARRSSTPARMEQRYGTRWMGDEDRNAIGNRDGQGQFALERDMPIGIVHPEPARPIICVRYDTRPVNLGRGGQARSAW